MYTAVPELSANISECCSAEDLEGRGTARLQGTMYDQSFTTGVELDGRVFVEGRAAGRSKLQQ